MHQLILCQMQSKLHQQCCELLPDTMYFPDSEPHLFCLFSTLKNWITEKNFTSNIEVIVETNTYVQYLMTTNKLVNCGYFIHHGESIEVYNRGTTPHLHQYSETGLRATTFPPLFWGHF